jgi:hypothetical protein
MGLQTLLQQESDQVSVDQHKGYVPSWNKRTEQSRTEQNRAEQSRTDGTEQMIFESELEQKFFSQNGSHVTAR